MRATSNKLKKYVIQAPGAIQLQVARSKEHSNGQYLGATDIATGADLGSWRMDVVIKFGLFFAKSLFCFFAKTKIMQIQIWKGGAIAENAAIQD